MSNQDIGRAAYVGVTSCDDSDFAMTCSAMAQVMTARALPRISEVLGGFAAGRRYAAGVLLPLRQQVRL